jgi:hypothetical protein
MFAVCRSVGIVFGFLLAACAASNAEEPIREVTLVSSPDKAGAVIRLSCDRAESSLAACALSVRRTLDSDYDKPDGKVYRFPDIAAPHLQRLIRIAADEAIERPSPDFAPLQAEEIALMREVSSSAAHCRAEATRGDLMVLCPGSDGLSASAILFFRALCDRCRFQPISIRKK